jgi:hypothetical protein
VDKCVLIPWIDVSRTFETHVYYHAETCQWYFLDYFADFAGLLSRPGDKLNVLTFGHGIYVVELASLMYLYKVIDERNRINDEILGPRSGQEKVDYRNYYRTRDFFVSIYNELQEVPPRSPKENIIPVKLDPSPSPDKVEAERTCGDLARAVPASTWLSILWLFIGVPCVMALFCTLLPGVPALLLIVIFFFVLLYPLYRINRKLIKEAREEVRRKG